MKFIQTNLKKVHIIEYESFNDNRGTFCEIYNKEIFGKKLKNINFLTDSFSYSRKNVLRGLHGDFKTWKLITCLEGLIYMIVVNNNKSQKDYKKWINLELSNKSKRSLFVPPGYGVGYFVKSKTALVHYKQSTIYEKKKQFSIKWNDKNYNFIWPKIKPILSDRDK